MVKGTEILLVVLMMVTIIASGCLKGPDTGQVPTPGNPAPDFQLQSLDGQAVSLSALRGKPVFINFWATWCGPCRMEMPFLQQLSEDQEWTKRGLVILAVNLGEPAVAVQEFMDANGLSFTVLLDYEEKVGMLYNTRYIPTTYLVDNDGIIRHVKTGSFMSKSDIDRALINLFLKN